MGEHIAAWWAVYRSDVAVCLLEPPSLVLCCERRNGSSGTPGGSRKLPAHILTVVYVFVLGFNTEIKAPCIVYYRDFFV